MNHESFLPTLVIDIAIDLIILTNIVSESVVPRST